MYDASNDWAYDIPTWKDVQDAFKAGSEWKKDLALTIEDVALLRTVFNAIDACISLGGLRVLPATEEYYEEILKRFNERNH